LLDGTWEHQSVRVPEASGHADVELIRRMIDAIDAGDEDALTSVLAEDIEYVFVSQGTYPGVDDVAAVFIAEVQRFRMDQDLFTADGSGRVWWRYEAHWSDAETGRPRRTTGASVAQVEDSRFRSVMSWVDVIAAGQDVDATNA
jgi:ketosteroid isomerase-like protein